MSIKNVIYSEDAPAAIGPYSQAICIGALVYTSGQIPIDPSTGRLVEGRIVEQTHQVLKNLGEVLAGAELAYSNVIKTTVFLKDMEDFTEFNKVYSSYFTQEYPARSCVQVAALPMGAAVEIECVAARSEIVPAG